MTIKVSRLRWARHIKRMDKMNWPEGLCNVNQKEY